MCNSTCTCMLYLKDLHKKLEKSNLDPKEVEKAKAGQVSVYNMSEDDYASLAMVNFQKIIKVGSI